MHSVRMAKKWFEKKLKGKKPTGRPWKWWIEQVKQDLEGSGVDWHHVKEEGVYMDGGRWRVLL